jgi:hypothetical protein
MALIIGIANDSMKTSRTSLRTADCLPISDVPYALDGEATKWYHMNGDSAMTAVVNHVISSRGARDRRGIT